MLVYDGHATCVGIQDGFLLVAGGQKHDLLFIHSSIKTVYIDTRQKVLREKPSGNSGSATNADEDGRSAFSISS